MSQPALQGKMSAYEVMVSDGACTVEAQYVEVNAGSLVFFTDGKLVRAFGQGEWKMVRVLEPDEQE